MRESTAQKFNWSINSNDLRENLQDVLIHDYSSQLSIPHSTSSVG